MDDQALSIWEDPVPEDSKAEEALFMDQDTCAPKHILKKLNQRHKDVCAFVAQGMKRSEIQPLVGYTPEYISMLMRQPLCIAEVQRLNAYQAARLEAMFGKAVDVMADAMDHGNMQERLQGARLQMEATKRLGKVGPTDPETRSSEDRLEGLAHRILGLLDRSIVATQHQPQELSHD